MFVHPSDTSFCLICSSLTGLLPSMNTGPPLRSGAATTKAAAAAASNIAPAIGHMIARFMAPTPGKLASSPRRESAGKHAAFKAGLAAQDERSRQMIAEVGHPYRLICCTNSVVRMVVAVLADIAATR